MNQTKLFNLMALAILVVSVLFGGSIPAAAQTPQPPVNPKPPRITQADRQAAADRAADAGLVLPDATTDAMPMPVPDAAPQYFSHPNYANSPLPGNIVAEWNAIAQEFLQPTPMPGMSMSPNGISMATAFVYLSYVQAAVYNALLAIEGGFTVYNAVPAPLQYFLPVVMGGGGTAAAPISPAAPKPALATDPTASREAAVATAAFKVLQHYFPTDTTLPVWYADSLASIPDGPAKTAGIAIGELAAAEIIALRAGDGLLAPNTYTVLPPAPGVWQPAVLPDSTVVPPIDPWMAQLKPFTFNTSDQFRATVGTPWALTSAEYAAEVNYVKEWGGTTSTLRTPQQTSIAAFWTTNNVIQFNSAYRNVAAAQGMNLLDTARLMAMGNMIGTDALVSCFDTKYTYSFWRPIAAIRGAAMDGNDATIPDELWTPALMTPNFPEFVAGHSCYVAAQGEVFKAVLGTDQIQLDLESLVTGQTRHYATAADLRAEVNNARVWGGMHYPGSTALGETLGLTVAENALRRFFKIDPVSDTNQHQQNSGGIRKFVDDLPVLCDPSLGPCPGTPTLGQYLPVAVPDTTTYTDTDYYEIGLVQYQEQLHSDLPPTLLRGYVQLSTSVVPGQQVPLSNVLQDGTLLPTGYNGVTPPHYLGPTIVATKNRPVRIVFRNLLPATLDGGNLFLPVDVTVMGSGMAPGSYNLDGTPMVEPDPQNPMCATGDPVMKADLIAQGICYAENRATLHLHGGISPWISDGTPHQWITPANENTPYPEGVSVVNVPDMADPGPGAMTFYYTNLQSARLMFYHDHSWGITRLNVYAGEAAPYLITDDTEQSLIAQSIIPGPESTIPLVVQDKTFVPGLAQLAASDNTWDTARWGSYGDLWLPHVYSPAQNPGDASGVNQFGRWAYGPWFWPPTTDIDYPPVANPYYDPTCNPDLTWCEPPLMPGTPYNSMGMEAFMDTPVVNGTAYPTITLEPKAYRFRVLNAANDRFFNLSLYKAVDANGVLCDPANTNPAAASTGITCTEVLLNPDEVAAALADPTIFPTPLAGTEGPNWIQIGTEGGFLPAPAVIPAQPTTWVNDPTVFNAGNVDLHSLLLGPAERADVIVDFSQYAGQTLILYNDAPAAFPARDPRYDYYTGNGDYRETGGTPPTLPGYGPNTRTVMQIKIAGTPAPAFNQTALETAFKATSLGGQGVFQNGQHPIIVGQGAYNSAYGTSFFNNGPLAGLVQIFNTSFTFQTLLGDTLTMPLQPKQIQDEMGEAFDHEYGRMSGYLGVETANAQAGLQNMILYPYLSPPTEILKGLSVPLDAQGGLELTPIATTNDGTQIWKITHNGVDTHPIHFHLYDIQLINRVGWDGIIRKPDANELGWKDTVRVSPLEDTIVALRPTLPVVPFDLPNSVRLIDPSAPEGVYLANSTQQEAMGLPIYAFNPDGEPIDIINHVVNYGFEYVWHCHILSHEEMDMMHAQVVGAAPRDPSDLLAVVSGTGPDRVVTLTWTDNSLNETGFVIERAAEDGVWAVVDEVTINTQTYVDLVGEGLQVFSYRVKAINTVGDTWDYSDPLLNKIPVGGGFPTLTVESAYSNIAVMQ